jgi:prevent-host-death family protein
MKTTFGITDAKTHLSKLIDRAAAGEEIVIAKAGKPTAKLVPYRPIRKKRIGGQNLLGITYIADDFDAPLPPEIQKYFDGEGETFPDPAGETTAEDPRDD